MTKDLADETSIALGVKTQETVVRSLAVGVLIGALMGFVNSYGYAVTGYIVAEISLVVVPIIARLLLGGRAEPQEIFLASVAAFGVSFSTVITSGMVITFFLTSNIYQIFYRANDFPQWLYSDVATCLPNIFACQWPYTYIALAALSLTGVGFAYMFRHIFLDKLNLPYPIGIASALMSQIVTTVRTSRIILLSILAGILLQLGFLILPTGSVDLTPLFAEKGLGVLVKLSLDVTMLLIALIIPPRISGSIGSGSIITSLFLLPLGASLALYPVRPGASSDELLNASSWYLASLVFGSVIPLLLAILKSIRTPLVYLLRTINESARSLSLMLLLFVGLLGLLVLAYLRSDSPGPWFIFFGLILVMIIIPLLIIITSWGAGEAGTVSQAFYPSSTVYMYVTGFRGFAPYVYLDHYLGVPMPSALSAASLQILRGSRILGVSPLTALTVFSLSYLLGSLVTIYYGALLISIYGNDPSKMPLDRWIPYTIWSLTIYRGELDPWQTLPGATVGAVTATMLLLANRFLGQALSPIPFIIGLTLPSDLGVLFILGSFIRWLVSRFGAVAEKQFVMLVSSALAGAGIAIVIYTFGSMFGLF
ncbi:MAG: hypothetical protein QXI22_01375 [Sulfolobales archaeon]